MERGGKRLLGARKNPGPCKSAYGVSIFQIFMIRVGNDIQDVAIA